MKAIIVTERNGWTWRIEPQDGDTDGSGVDIVYQEDYNVTTGHKNNNKESRTCIGDWDDAEALAKAILAYVEFARKQ